jgi:predicted RNA-binding protein with PUA-like domain
MLALRHLRGTPYSAATLPMHWLMKSEPDECSFSDALHAPKSTVAWVGVRNYQARNFMRDQMRIGDGVLFYHSSCPVPGIYGLAEVCSQAYPDPTQFDPKSKYFDPKSDPSLPAKSIRWQLVDVKALGACQPISLASLRGTDTLSDMILLQRGSRLSITPVNDKHWRIIKKMMLPLP